MAMKKGDIFSSKNRKSQEVYDTLLADFDEQQSHRASYP